MSTIKDGGPAFPWGEHGTHLGGMTLRDYFAAEAMQGDWCAQNESNGSFTPEVQDKTLMRSAVLYYRMADAMLAAREAQS